MKGGWLKLWRKIDDNPLMSRPAYLAVWIDILLQANHEPGARVMFRGEVRELGEGQFTSGAYQISRRRGVPRGTVERIINCFKNEELIEVETDGKCSLITVKNWNIYQKSEEVNEELVRNKRGTGEELVRTNKEVKKLRTEEITTNNQRAVAASPPGVQEVMKAFYSQVNPGLNFGNKTQREAAAFLVDRFGLDPVLDLVGVLKSTNGQPYAPVITTPLALKEKMAQLQAFISQKSQKDSQGSKRIVL